MSVEPEILPGPHYKPLMHPATASLGGSIFRKMVEAAVETLIPVAGSGITELYRHSHPPLADRIRDIENILQGDPGSAATREAAAELCSRIAQFNENVAALAFERRA